MKRRSAGRAVVERLAAVTSVIIASAAFASVAVGAPQDATGNFPFHNGDRVVFLGDSITEQRLYTTYLETYLLTRFPTWDLEFRNAGWGGDTSYLRTRGVPPDQALQRDVLDLHPTIVTVDFGMNDAGYGGFNQGLYDQHFRGEQNIVKQLQAAGVLPVLLTASAVEKQEQGNDMEGYNQTLAQFAAGDRMIAQKAGIPFADQLHPFVAAINRIREVDPKLRLSGDAVHPGQAGHLMMADFILTGLNAPPLVSAASIDAGSGRVTLQDHAHVSSVVRSGGGVSFQRLDDALVFPIEPAARDVLKIVPVVDDLDRYLLQISHLVPGEYQLTINGTPVARYSEAQLAEGVNLAHYFDSPLAAQGLEILGHVYNKNNIYFNLWRNVRLHNDPDKDAKIADLGTQISNEEKAINALRTPKTYQFSVMPVPVEQAPAPSAQ